MRARSRTTGCRSRRCAGPLVGLPSGVCAAALLNRTCSQAVPLTGTTCPLPQWVIGIAAEGTRSRGEYWKSGFYRIAQQTGLPITLAFLDVPSRTVGWGPTFHPTGDVSADMDVLRDFYADKTGFNPEGFTPPRLREEG